MAKVQTTKELIAALIKQRDTALAALAKFRDEVIALRAENKALNRKVAYLEKQLQESFAAAKEGIETAQAPAKKERKPRTKKAPVITLEPPMVKTEE